MMFATKDHVTTMSRTGLMFYRKKQVLEDLETERPKSLGAVRQAIRRAAENIDNKVRLIEREFYGGATCDDDIRATIPHVRSVCATFEVTYIHGAYQIDEILNKQRVLDDDVKLDLFALDKLHEYHRKISAFVPTRFDDMIKDSELTISYMEKYLLSYCNDSKDKYMETANHYEKKRNELKDAILSHLRNITYMSRMYYDRGTPVKVFGLVVNELARRCDCGDMPFLLVFPQCCQNIRNVCQGILKWTDSDEEYASFIACDITEMETTRLEKLADMREKQHNHFVIDHRLKQNKREVNELEADLEKLYVREKANQKEVRRLEDDVRAMLLDIDMLEDKRDVIKQRQLNDKLTDFTKQLKHIASDISELRYRIPSTKKEIDAVRNKISFITDKRELYQSKMKDMRKLKHDVTYTKMAAIVAETEMDRISNCHEVLKYIHLQKTCPASTRNIFFRRPSKNKIIQDKGKASQGRILKRNPNPDGKSKKDDLAKVTRVVAKCINSDWPKLYRKLPFYPARGKNNIDDDVTNITQERLRVADKVKATESLEKWRRMHTRANIDDLKGTLAMMNRSDVVQRIDKSLKQKIDTSSKIRKRWQNIRTLQLVTSRLVTYRSEKNAKADDDKTKGRGRGKVKLPRILVTDDN